MVVFKSFKENNCEFREFDKDLNDSELLWHFDLENRYVEILEGVGWFFQFDNSLPFELKKDETIYIPKNLYHRIFKKGITNLKIKIIVPKEI